MCLKLLCTLATIAAISGNMVTMVTGNSCVSGGIKLTATKEAKTLQSPGYPDDYLNNQLCRWEIRAEKKYEVVRIKVIDMRIDNSVGCQSDYLQIQDGTAFNDLTLKKCCKNICKANDMVTTSERETLITFRSDNSGNRRGFEIQYWTVIKPLKEYAKPEFSAINYLLFAIFTAIVSSIFVTIICIYIVHAHPSFCRKLFRMCRKKVSNKQQTTNGAVKQTSNYDMEHGSNVTSIHNFDTEHDTTVTTLRSPEMTRISSSGVFLDDEAF